MTFAGLAALKEHTEALEPDFSAFVESKLLVMLH